MTRRIPIIPTVIVAAAIATMIALGFWQLDRKGQKEALIAHAERSLSMSSEVEYPRDERALDGVLYRRTRVTCASLINATTVAGSSARGESGVAHRVTCYLPDGRPVKIDLGFSRDPAPVPWSGGEVSGMIAPGGRIVATDEVPGLELLALPDPRDLPNNHLAYAGQWFSFALTALVIYVLALRRRTQSGGREAKGE
ncbi:SURF1 family protein [Qipengyuania soli]|uniref:SURF1-like protein n=1 Tax=Qipengyuania soli TaxID=2782568 RepID=A0A7S8F5Q4_9SPHN|nr:SURF1 family protein [Qipengyuania soli]QPC99595.1 SURF1 family protein [Qipengyuania soli]